MASDAGLPGEAAPAALTPTRTRWTGGQIWVLILLVLVNISNYLDRGVIAILQEPIKAGLKLADWQLVVISGPAFAVLYSFAGIPVARLAERANRSTVLSIALTVWSGKTALCGAATTYVHLVVARLGVGAGEGACTPISHSLVSDTFPPRQRRMALAILSTSIPIAQLFAPLIGGVIAMQFGWRAAFLAAGLPGIMLAVLLRLTLRSRAMIRVTRSSPEITGGPAGSWPTCGCCSRTAPSSGSGSARLS